MARISNEQEAANITAKCAADILTDISGGIQLSADGKTVTGFQKPKAKGRVVIRIPDGVELIEDNAFLRVDFDSIYLPKTLKQIGEYTLYHPTSAPLRDSYAKTISSVEVEAGNPYFAADKQGFYEIKDSKKQLCFLLDRSVEEYIAPEDVVSFAAGAFDGCNNLKKLILSPLAEEFNEYSLPSNSKVEEIFIPKNVKYIIPKCWASGYAEWTTVRYHIDEANPHLFQDEDSIYEVLPDGTYKLLINMYAGKGKVLILEETSEIGKDAFQGHKNVTSIQFPKALRIIGESAFCQSGLKEVIIPQGVAQINEYAFSLCENLESVQIHSSVECIAENAFEWCYKLDRIKSDGKTNVFTLKDGKIRRAYVSSSVARSSTEPVSKPKMPEKDYFAEFAKVIAKVVKKSSVSDKNRAGDKATFDPEKRVVTITTIFSQQSESATVVKERVDCAETLSANSSIRIRVNGDVWEAVSEKGKSLGELYRLFARSAVPYLNYISFDNGTVATITPKSKRRNAKYALGAVTFEISERKLSKNLSDQDYETMAQFSYIVEENETRLIRWIGGTDIKRVTIPAMIEGKPVLSVGYVFNEDPWIGNANELEEIVISDGITHLESGALASLQKIKKVIIPASVKYISNDVFSGGGKRDTFLNSKTVYVTPAGSYADKFLQAYVPKTFDVKVLTVINNDSEEANDELKLLAAFNLEPRENGIVAEFKERYKLSDFKETIVSVPSYASGRPLQNLSLRNIPHCVERLVIPASVTNLIDANDEYTFYNNNGMALETIEVAEDNPVYWSDGSAIFSKDRKTLIRYLAYTKKTYCVPVGTERVSERAFANMSNLESLILPSSLKYIGSYAFSGCTSLADIQGLECVIETGDLIFSGSSPFEANIPMLIVGTSLFRCNDLSQKVIQVPDGVTRICEYSFGKEDAIDNVEEIILPPSVSELKHSAFNGRKKLKKINIPEGIVEIPNRLFSGCAALEVLHIPASVANIDHNAFPWYYDGSTYVTECALREVKVASNNNTYCSIDGMLLSKDKTKLLFVPSAITADVFVIPEGVKQICSGAVCNNSTLRELIIPEGVTSVEESAFSNCVNLEKVAFPAKLESIGKYAFSGCAKLTTVIWPEGLQTIGDAAFVECGLYDVNLPNSVKHIGSEAFAKVKAQRVILPKSVQTLGWGAFSCVPEIEVYDSIDPDAKDANAGIDWANGYPNSMVGFVGMGPAWARWQCAANHRWVDYTITVRSAITDEIKYKVWMGADSSQRDYFCFLSSAWGHNATFAFENLDQFFSRIRGKHHKLQVALYRLAYPWNLSAEAKAKYENYVKKNKDA